jgi:hypothetical protein
VYLCMLLFGDMCWDGHLNEEEGIVVTCDQEASVSRRALTCLRARRRSFTSSQMADGGKLTPFW